MELTFFQLCMLGIIVALANVLGGLALLPLRFYRGHKGLLKHMLALGAGFMLTVTFIEILPKTIQLWENPNFESETAASIYIPMVLLLAGYLLTQFFEHTIAPHIHIGEEKHSDYVIPTASVYTVIVGLLIHAFFYGVSISAAYHVDSKIGTLMFIVVLLHKFPEGFTIASIVLSAGKGVKEVLISTLTVGFATFVGVLIFYFIEANIELIVAYAFPVSGGVTLYVAASVLIPEVDHHGGKNPLVSLSIFAGVTIFFVLHILLDNLFAH